MTAIEGARSSARSAQCRTLVRYVLVGATQNGVCYSIGLGLILLGLKGWQALLITFPMGMLLSFGLNKIWSFRGRAQPKGQAVRYIVLYAVTCATATGCVWALEQSGWAAWLAILVVTAGASILLFVVVNLWVFPQRRGAADPTCVRES